MSPRELGLFRHAFAAVMLRSAAKAHPEHFYPLNMAGGFPDFRPEGMFQAFLEALKLARSRDATACGNCGRVDGSPDGGCDWQECPGHTRPLPQVAGRDEGIEQAFAPACRHSFRLQHEVKGGGTWQKRVYRCDHCGGYREQLA